jgi:AcrR family transcriptional regulator
VAVVMAREDDEVQVRRGRGRPREADLDRAILEAAIDELCSSGTANLTFDRVAAVSGVAKTTIYRRWTSKTQLIIDAIDLLRGTAPVVHTGNTRVDLEQSLDNMVQIFASPRGRAIAAVYAERRFNEDLAAAWETKISAPHRAGFKEIIARGVARGELKDTIEIGEIQDMLAGVAFAVLHGETKVKPGLAARAVDTILSGIACGDRTPATDGML